MHYRSPGGPGPDREERSEGMRNTVTARSRGAPGSLAAALLVAVLGALPAWAQDDPTGSWSPESPGVNFSSGGSATDGTYLYVAGGLQNAPGEFNFPADLQALRRYDPVSNTWVTLGALPFPVSDNAAAFHSGRLFSFGGFNFDAGAITDQICTYDIATDTWAVDDDVLSMARQRAAAASLGNRIYVIGGDTGDLTDANDEVNPA